MLISSENMTTALSVFLATASAMFRAMEVFPMPGRAAISSRVGLVESVDLGIQIFQACRQAGNGTVGTGTLGQLIVDVQQNGTDVLQILIAAAVADGVDFLLGGIHDALGRAHLFGDDLGDVLCRLRNLPQQGFICYDLSILLCIGGGGRDIENLKQIVPGLFFIIDARTASSDP